MREASDSTATAGAAPSVAGMLVAIFVPDEHPLLWLKATLDWEAITAVMVEHWRAAGKNVAGGRGLPWPVPFYVPLLVLMWLECWHARQMEKYLSESVVARRFLDLTDTRQMHIRDHSNIARAEAALGAAGKAAVNALLLHQAKALNFTNGAVLSSDTTVQEPALGYPNEPGILKGWAERLARSFKKLHARGVAGAQAGLEKTKEIVRQVKQHHLWAKTKAEKKALLTQLVATSEALLKQTQEVLQQVSTRCGQAKQKAVARVARDGRRGPPLVAANQALVADGQSGGRQDHSRRTERSARHRERQKTSEVRLQVASQPVTRRLRVWPARGGASRRKPASGWSLRLAGQVLKRIWRGLFPPALRHTLPSVVPTVFVQLPSIRPQHFYRATDPVAFVCAARIFAVARFGLPPASPTRLGDASVVTRPGRENCAARVGSIVCRRQLIVLRLRRFLQLPYRIRAPFRKRHHSRAVSAESTAKPMLLHLLVFLLCLDQHGQTRIRIPPLT